MPKLTRLSRFVSNKVRACVGAGILLSLAGLTWGLGGCCLGAASQVHWYFIQRNEQNRNLDVEEVYGRRGHLFVVEGGLPSCTEIRLSGGDWMQADWMTFVLREDDGSLGFSGQLVYYATVASRKVGVDTSKDFLQEGYLAKFTVPERWAGECPTMRIENYMPSRVQ